MLTILQVNSDLFCFTRYAEAQLLPPSAVKEEEIDPFGGTGGAGENFLVYVKEEQGDYDER